MDETKIVTEEQGESIGRRRRRHKPNGGQNQNQGQGQGQYEIDLLQMLKDLLNRWYIIAISAILCGLIALTYTVC